MQPLPAWDAFTTDCTFDDITTTQLTQNASILIWEESSIDGGEGTEEVSLRFTLAVVAETCHAMPSLSKLLAKDERTLRWPCKASVKPAVTACYAAPSMRRSLWQPGNQAPCMEELERLCAECP